MVYNSNTDSEFFQTSLYAAPIGFIVFDEDMRIIDVNNIILDLLKCEKQYYIEHFFEFLPEFQSTGDNSREKLPELIKKTLDGGNFVFEWAFCTQSGDLIPFEITLMNVKHMGKDAALCYLYDLRKTKKVSLELENQKKQLQERLEQQEFIYEISKSFVSSTETKMLINEAIAKLGRYHKVSRVIIFHTDYKNGSANLMYQWTTDDYQLRKGNFDIHSFVKSSFPAALYSAFSTPIVSCPDTKSSKTENFWQLVADDVNAFICVPLYVEGLLWGVMTVEHCLVSRYWTDNEKRFIAIAANTIAGAITIDIYNSRLKETVTKMTAASKAKSEFLSNMSHEIRTPMNVIFNMASIAKNAEDIERKNYALDKIMNASTHLLGVINDILDMSKIEADKYELAPVKFNFEQMIMHVLDIINFRIEEKKQILKAAIDNNIPKELFCDDQRLSQVITNLLSNAVKFTPENGTIKLDAQYLGERNGICTIQITITDTGIGISTEQQKNLFQPFHQAETSVTRTYGGTGLGLSISKSFVEKMGGTIWVESEIGKGAVFTFTIQAQRCISPEIDETNRSAVYDELPYDFIGRKILLVEDLDINRTIVQMLLEETNLEIECAENGEQAVLTFCENPEKYEVILMDIHMPVMDGYEATRRIRLFEKEMNEKSGQKKRTPIIAMTANVFKEDIDLCLNAGMDDHLGKPVDVKALITKLQTYLRI